MSDKYARDLAAQQACPHTELLLHLVAEQARPLQGYLAPVSLSQSREAVYHTAASPVGLVVGDVKRWPPAQGTSNAQTKVLLEESKLSKRLQHVP